MSLPRLVATDLDGTLLRSDLTISDRTMATLARLEAAGIVLVLVTGRPLRWLAPVLGRTGRRGTVVCANGAVVVDGASGEVLAAWPLAPAVLAEATARLRAALPGVLFAVEDALGMRREAAYPVRSIDQPGERVVPFAELAAEPGLKLLVRAPGVDPDAVRAACRHHLDGLATPTSSTLSGLVEVSAAGVTKATGLAWVADRAGVPASAVVAFGDMPNDLPMLAWAGHAVVVAGAHPEALAAADAVAGGNDEDGVAAYLDALLDLP